MPKKTAKKILKKKSRNKKQKGKPAKYLTYENLDTAGEVAVYYGFTPIHTPEIKKADLEKARVFSHDDVADKNLAATKDCEPPHLEEKIAILRAYEEKGMSSLPQPVMLYYKGEPTHPYRKEHSKERKCGLEIIGTTKSIAEALLIETAITILREEGYKNVHVEINSIGDKESINRFTREITAYYRKNLHLLSAQCRQAFKKDVYGVLSCGHEKCIDIAKDAPKPVSYLSESSRTHFKEVLEYLETLEIPYTINGGIIGNRNYCSETLFEIKENSENEKEGRALAIGLRYDTLSKKIGMKRDAPGIGVKFSYKKIVSEKTKDKKILSPKIYFVQLGFGAKLKSLKVVEVLRQARIPILQSLNREKLIGQLAVAEKMKVPYLMLMGQKEAVENSVIIRNMSTRSQDTVSLNGLSDYLKKHKIC